MIHRKLKEILARRRSSCWERIERKLDHIIQLQEHTMATLNDITAAVAAEKTVEDSVMALLTQVSQSLKDAIASSDPTAMQKIVDDIDAHRKALADAVVANTPAPPAP